MRMRLCCLGIGDGGRGISTHICLQEDRNISSHGFGLLVIIFILFLLLVWLYLLFINEAQAHTCMRAHISGYHIWERGFICIAGRSEERNHFVFKRGAGGLLSLM